MYIITYKYDEVDPWFVKFMGSSSISLTVIINQAETFKHRNDALRAISAYRRNHPNTFCKGNFNVLRKKSINIHST